MKYVNDKWWNIYKIEKKHNKADNNQSEQIILCGWKHTVCLYSIGFSSFFSIL